MAVLPSKSAANGKAAAGARFRQRKISVKAALPIYNQRDVVTQECDLEPLQLHHLNAQREGIETGVDKNEEDEVHLQQVINAAQRVLMGLKEEVAKPVFIPTPDALRLWPEASKYYAEADFAEPDSYIKFSATVEDTLGVEYNMDEADAEFFAQLDMLELEFELVCDKFEKVVDEKQPFLLMDPSNVLAYGEIVSFLQEPAAQHRVVLTLALKEQLSKELRFEPFVTCFDKRLQLAQTPRPLAQLLLLYGERIYSHWRLRKIARKGRHIVPDLKFEDPNANERDNDNDPYVCFRRREFRQARKTRRADNLGAERLRLMQRLLKKARDLVFMVCKRELLKLDLWAAELDVFEKRCAAKAAKRAAQAAGDEHLFYPHKRRKIVHLPVEEELEPEVVRPKREKRREEPGRLDSLLTQPYIWLPPSKVPDMDLVTVSLVLKEKNEKIKQAVLDMLRKRKEHDKGYVNVTYDPYQPFFDIATNRGAEVSHIPYSLIAASHYHQISTLHVIGDHLKKVLEEGKRPLPGVKTYRGTGDPVPLTPFPHLQTLLREHAGDGYVARLLANVHGSAYSGPAPEKGKVSEPVFRMRRRAARGHQEFVDRRGLVHRPSWDALESKDAYHSEADAVRRLDLRWRFDRDYTDYDEGLVQPFGLDPLRLNSISDETQLIRFGLMLLLKLYELLTESAHQRRLLVQQARQKMQRGKFPFRKTPLTPFAKRTIPRASPVSSPSPLPKFGRP